MSIEANTNALKHGSCSQQLVLRTENAQEYAMLRKIWFNDYNPQDQNTAHLVEEVAQAHWILRRNKRNFNEAQHCVYDEQPNPMDWTEEQHQRLERFTRYLTRAERSFTRFQNQLEALRKSRISEANTERRLALKEAELALKMAEQEQAKAQPEPKPVKQKKQKEEAPKTPAGELFQSQYCKKKMRKIHILDQWVEVRIENGQTVTRLYPSNDKLIRFGQEMEHPPELVYRRINFPHGVPEEYNWCLNPKGDEQHREIGGLGTQRMTTDTWLQVIAKEKERQDGHIGPTGVGNLPRPLERGGCECDLCTHNRTIIEAENKEMGT